jgi:hypothetical protein
MSTVNWLGVPFQVGLQGANWNAVGGVYIFALLNRYEQWVPLYIGQAQSFKDRIPNHEVWLEAARLGATHVHARVEPLKANRDRLEQALIGAYQPALNVQHR